MARWKELLYVEFAVNEHVGLAVTQVNTTVHQRALNWPAGIAFRCLVRNQATS